MTGSSWRGATGIGSHPEGAGDGSAPGFGGGRHGEQRDRKGKRRPQGRTATPPAEVAARTGQILTEREAEWLDRLARDPAGAIHFIRLTRRSLL